MPHPSEEMVNIRVQTTGKTRPGSGRMRGEERWGSVWRAMRLKPGLMHAGELSANQVLRNACDNLKDVCEHMKATIKDEVAKKVK
jgi:DNA-directed RNA polymerase subunit L